jgi:hypothetical protein
MEEFSGIVIAITNRYQQVDTACALRTATHQPRFVRVHTAPHARAVVLAVHRRFKFIMEFPTPDALTRTKLWRLLIPAAAPLKEDVDFEQLGQSFELTGGHLKSAVFRAAVEASLQVRACAARPLNGRSHDASSCVSVSAEPTLWCGGGCGRLTRRSASSRWTGSSPQPKMRWTRTARASGQRACTCDAALGEAGGAGRRGVVGKNTVSAPMVTREDGGCGLLGVVGMLPLPSLKSRSAVRLQWPVPPLHLCVARMSLVVCGEICRV